MHARIFNLGDIVCFKRVYKIDVIDLINREKHYSKYMIILSVVDGISHGRACKVLCANGEINWVAASKLKKIE